MLKFITNLFTGKKPEAPVAATPYKMEAPTIQDAPVKGTVTKEAVRKAVKAAKKPAVKKATTRKPKSPKS